ncbi:E3 ubiquitin-protein ligase PUB24-like [Salvia miltiorrhiza]|uniref:E3 ubiquitin-protein ligase PUB24-like n=1 Tax=Salvia miltiorrhiza TaxID=226208 RepID=UPI0025AB608E|nr:E3 ubiquitin-protein ligase PUB24-like [Salvia miltiorrhiza]
MDGEIEIPEYFLCPISLQIMKDPVTTVTGITFDRDSIEQWLATAAAVCPVTKQPLPRSSDLTPNHMLRRLIQAWCTANAIDRIPTPKSPLQRSIVVKLIRDVNRRGADPSAQMNALTKLDDLAAEDDGGNRRCMAEAGVPKAMLSFVIRSFKGGSDLGISEALRVLKLTWTPAAEIIAGDNPDLIQSVMWILKIEIEDSAKSNALVALKNFAEIASSTLIEKLDLEFFGEMVRILKERRCAQGVRAALHVLIQTCSSGRNRAMVVAAGAVAELIEMELSHPEKKTTELVFGLLAQLCSCADGRQQLLKHAAGMAVVAKRLLRNSAATDDRALCVMESVARFAATQEVVAEMLRVGAVAKLCMVMQADCADYMKKKAREILRLHSADWSNSPCIQVYLLTRNPR